MAIENFIPAIWSETLYQELNQRHIGVAHCNRDFEGEIREKGNIVKICGLENVSIHDYRKNQDMNLPETLKDFSADLVIDHAKYFNFQIDDIDRAQASPQLMKLAMSNAAIALADAADYAVMNLNTEVDAPLSEDFENPTPENILEQIIRAREIMYKANVLSSDDLYLEVSPFIASILMKAKICTYTDNTQLIESGSLGSVMGCKVYVSKNIKAVAEDNPDIYTHRCFLRTKRSIAFVEQLSEIEAYRPERRFADAIKGLYLFGCKCVYPKELLEMKFHVDASIYPTNML